ncbi:MAG: ribonuclease HI family protein [bacterium]
MSPGTLRIWCDGASRGNPGPASIGVVVKDSNDLIVHEGKMVIGTATNNVAEYRALIYGLMIASPMMPEALEVRMDSELVVKQMKGEYKVKDYKMQQLHAEAKLICEDFESVRFIHVRREENMLADALANEALDEA